MRASQDRTPSSSASAVSAAAAPAVPPDGEFFRPLRLAQPPAIDGRLDDAVWRDAPVGRAGQDLHSRLRPGAQRADRRLHGLRRREPLLRLQVLRPGAGQDQGRRGRPRHHPRRRLHLHQPRHLQRPAVPLRLLRQPARHPDRQPLRQRQGGLQRRLRLVRAPAGIDADGYTVELRRAVQEHPLRREDAGRDVHLLRAPHLAAARSTAPTRPSTRPAATSS